MIEADQFIKIRRRSTLHSAGMLGSRVHCSHGMLPLMITAWEEGGRLIGIARFLTDFLYPSYRSEWAVDKACLR